MNEASEVRPFSVMKQTLKRYNNLFKAQLVYAPLGSQFKRRLSELEVFVLAGKKGFKSSLKPT